MKMPKVLKRQATEEEISLLGHQLHRTADAVFGRVFLLERQPLTVAQHLGVAKVEIGIGFADLDRMLASADAILAEQPDAMFMMHASPHALAAAADQLRGALAAAEPYRSLTPA